MVDAAMLKIQQFCADHFGLCPDLLSDREWKRTLSKRLQATSTDSFESYYQFLKSSVDEIQELIEALIVPETWFFRDKTAFEILVNHCLKTIHRPIHLLSIPCGSGEEPYTMAMSLLDKGLGKGAFSVDGVDISNKALKYANEGLYQKRSFRGKSLSYRERYFDESDKGYLIKANVRDHVHFYWGNIVDTNSMKALKTEYEAIFCRNLLIYLHEEARKKLFHFVKEHLAPEGLLFVAPAELDIAKHYGFRMAGSMRSCALVLEKPHVETSRPRSVQNVAPIVPSKRLVEEQKLSQANLVADLGDYRRAEQLCLEHLKKHGDDANAYYLLGVISHAKNQVEMAKDYFNRAIYLEPDHADALFYLALLAEQHGDVKQAALLRNRARQR